MSDFDLFEKLPEGFRLATEEDIPMVTLTIAQAFVDYKYPIPSIEIPYKDHLAFFYDLTEGCVRNAIKYGNILTNEDFTAAMSVVPYERRANYGVDSLYENLKKSSGKDVADNMAKIFEYIDEKENDIILDPETVYVEQFAVQTVKQGQKVGSKLMRELFAQCERKNRSVFLYTNTQKNKEIYNHFGFKTILSVHEEEINSDTFYLLWQPPKKAKANDSDELKISSFYPVWGCNSGEIENTVSFLSGLGFNKLHHFKNIDVNYEGYVLGNDAGSKVDLIINNNSDIKNNPMGMRMNVNNLDKAIEYAEKHGFKMLSEIIINKTNKMILAESSNGMKYYFIEHIKNKHE